MTHFGSKLAPYLKFWHSLRDKKFEFVGIQAPKYCQNVNVIPIFSGQRTFEEDPLSEPRFDGKIEAKN